MAQDGMSGYWKFSMPNGGINYMELKQTGETVSTAGRRPMSGTLRDGKLHLQSGSDPNDTVIDATVKGDKSTASRTTHDGQWGGVEVGTLERVAAEEVHPARLPLPELRELFDDGLARTPPMGWSSWNKLHDKLDDATDRTMADAMVASGMNKVGYSYIIVDEG